MSGFATLERAIPKDAEHLARSLRPLTVAPILRDVVQQLPETTIRRRPYRTVRSVETPSGLLYVAFGIKNAISYARVFDERETATAIIRAWMHKDANGRPIYSDYLHTPDELALRRTNNTQVDLIRIDEMSGATQAAASVEFGEEPMEDAVVSAERLLLDAAQVIMGPNTLEELESKARVLSIGRTAQL